LAALAAEEGVLALMRLILDRMPLVRPR